MVLPTCRGRREGRVPPRRGGRAPGRPRRRPPREGATARPQHGAVHTTDSGVDAPRRRRTRWSSRGGCDSCWATVPSHSWAGARGRQSRHEARVWVPRSAHGERSSGERGPRRLARARRDRPDVRSVGRRAERVRTRGVRRDARESRARRRRASERPCRCRRGDPARRDRCAPCGRSRRRRDGPRATPLVRRCPELRRPATRGAVAPAARDVGARVIVVVHDERPHSIRSGTEIGLRGMLRHADMLVAHTAFVGDTVPAGLDEPSCRSRTRCRSGCSPGRAALPR